MSPQLCLPFLAPIVPGAWSPPPSFGCIVLLDFHLADLPPLIVLLLFLRPASLLNLDTLNLDSNNGGHGGLANSGSALGGLGGVIPGTGGVQWSVASPGSLLTVILELVDDDRGRRGCPSLWPTPSLALKSLPYSLSWYI